MKIVLWQQMRKKNVAVYNFTVNKLTARAENYDIIN